jgi:hypothetical protein
MTGLVSREEIVRQFGESEILTVDRLYVDGLDIPGEAKRILSSVGLPLEAFPFRACTEMNPPTHIIPEKEDQNRSYYKIGTDMISCGPYDPQAIQVCLEAATGRVIAIVPGGNPSRQVVNSTLDRFLRSLIEMARFEAEHPDLEERNTADFRQALEQDLRSIDPDVPDWDNSFWHDVLEYSFYP